jgi:RNA recognition motif-containing protein
MPEVEPKTVSSTKHFKVFFGNLSYFTTYPQLRSLLSSYGPIHAMNICKSKDSDPLYYGFVHFNDIAQAERVVKELHGKKFLGRRLQ